jgi:hypothetical protein
VGDADEKEDDEDEDDDEYGRDEGPNDIGAVAIEEGGCPTLSEVDEEEEEGRTKSGFPSSGVDLDGRIFLLADNNFGISSTWINIFAFTTSSKKKKYDTYTHSYPSSEFSPLISLVFFSFFSFPPLLNSIRSLCPHHYSSHYYYHPPHPTPFFFPSIFFSIYFYSYDMKKRKKLFFHPHEKKKAKEIA